LRLHPGVERRFGWAGSAAKLGPAPVGAVQVSPTVSAVDHCSVLLAFHAAAISRNLESLFTSIDPEGPHQLRVALRRLRVVTRVFEPVMRRDAREAVRTEAQKIGSIVSELRDADVMIGEIIGPEARAQPSLIAALDGWRQEVRGRVRARLSAVRADAFALKLSIAAATLDWRKKGHGARGVRSAELTDAFVNRSWARAASAIGLLHEQAPAQVHELRKSVKALRYASEFGAGLAREDHRKLAAALKRVQDALGYVNDVHMLKRFAPALVAESDAVSKLCKRLIAERADDVHERLGAAQAMLRDIAASKVFAEETAPLAVA
jgi:triphosphatase